MTLTTGVIKTNTTPPAGRLGLTHKRPSYRPIRAHLSPRSVSVWRTADRFIVIDKQANSLHSLIADGTYRATSLGHNEWKKLIGAQGSLQLNCNKEGFNAVGTASHHSKARIGYIANEQNNCHSCNSRIGFGTGGYPDNSTTCGNVAAARPDNGDRYIKAMGYILVQ